MSRFGIFTISGSKYDLDDLDLDEVEAIEELCGGQAFSELNFGSAKTMKAIAFTLMRRDHPDMVYADVGKVKMIDFAPPEEEMPALPPDQDDEASPNDSEQDGSGVPPSVVSITG